MILFKPEYIIFLVLVFSRVTAIISFLPIFGSRNIPVHVKIGLGLSISITVIFLMKDQSFILPSNLLAISSLIFKECTIGFVIGYIGRLIFSAVQLAGYIIGFQMGFAIVNVVDPNTSSQVSVISELKYMLAILVFFSINGHHIFFKAIIKSFDIIPVLGLTINTDIIFVILNLFKEVFIISIHLSAPIMSAILFINVGLGIIARTVPQINVFIIGFPLQIGVGLLILSVTISFFSSVMVRSFSVMERNIYMVLKLMS